MDLHRYARHLKGASVDFKKIVAGSLQAVNWRAMGINGGAGGVSAKGKVLEAGSKGWIRGATPKYTGLLARSWRGEAVENQLTLSTNLNHADISGPRYPKSPNGPQKRVSEYADQVNAKHGISGQVQRFMQRTFRSIVQAAMRRRIRSESAGGTDGV